MGYVQSLRLIASITLGCMTLVGFQFAGVSLTIREYFAALTVVAVSFATMIQNNYDDRYFDAKYKGKSYALENRNYTYFLLFHWTMALIMLAVLSYFDIGYGLVGIVAATIGMFYSKTYKIPLLPMVAVALANTLTLAFPVAIEAISLTQVSALFALSFSLWCLREIYKDEEDKNVDRLHKWTIPSQFGRPIV